MLDEGQYEWGGKFREAYANEIKKLGRFNLAIFGNTGAGKSTLVNAVFHAERAATGIGKPVTKGTNYYEDPSGIFGIFDCEGFETGRDGDEILSGLREEVNQRRSRPLSEQMHVAWYVVRWSDRRFEDSQASFVTALADMGLPVIVVLSQVPRTPAGDQHPEAVQLADEIARDVGSVIVDGRPILTNAKADVHVGQDAHGLDALLEATFRVAPEGVLAALTAAQRIDHKRKRSACTAIITGATATAAGVGAVPIPFSDAALLVPVQVAMMAGISARYGLPLDAGTIATLAGAAVFTGGATMAGRALANLIKFIPGAGSVIGGSITAAIAASLTTAMGWAWVAVCEYLTSLSDDDLRAVLANKSVLTDLFLKAFKEQARKGISRS